MALEDDVEDRYSAQILIEASNPQDESTNTLDATRLAKASRDVEAYFKILVGVVYDSTVDTHVAVAVEGVLLRLHVMTGRASVDEWETFKNTTLLQLAQITGRDRMVPSTDSLLTATPDTIGDLPAADRKNLRGYLPNAANNSTTDDSGD